MSDELSARRKKLTSLALAGAVFTGGAAGAAVTMVGAGAQDDTTTTTEAPVDGSHDESSRPDRGERLSDALAPLVEDGTIDQSQSDAVVEQLLEALPGPGEMGHRGHGGHLGHNVDAIAEALGMDAETLAEQLADGNTIADVAEAQGVDIQTIIDILVADLDEHLATAVEDGRITQEEADEKRADAVERITEQVNSETPLRGRGGPGFRGPHGDHGDSTDGADADTEADSASVSVS